jgi:hypothetical protein
MSSVAQRLRVPKWYISMIFSDSTPWWIHVSLLSRILGLRFITCKVDIVDTVASSSIF